MHYGKPVIRKTVPLAIGLVSVSNPVLPILDTLSKYSHDNNLQVALNAIFAIGLVGAGTNNARLAQMLRQLAGYYYKEPDCLFMVRVAQGLVHMGKGTIGLNPFFSDRNIMSRPAIAGLLATLTTFTDAKNLYPRQVPLDVVLPRHRHVPSLPDHRRRGAQQHARHSAGRPGQTFLLALVISHAHVRLSRPSTWSARPGNRGQYPGFQTHQTPVRLATTELAELATEEYVPFGHVLEGFVILQKNPGWEKEDRMEL
ncbi:hypothetical protein C8J57DRAFT_1524327 [Mycena rebaudengoi]|nr:hypothetical protein C8J57DRAFT_1524327 [Mycena rebaudengoi]